MAAAAILKHDGLLMVDMPRGVEGGGLPTQQPVSVSFSSGRRDALFPDVAAACRFRLRVDSVAAYSVTDQHTAQDMASLLRAAASVLWCTGSDSDNGGGHTRVSLPEAGTCPVPGHVPASGTVRVHRLPLVATDGTACAGGNAAALLQVFSRVTCVELDEARAADLAHNLRVLGHDAGPVQQAAVPEQRSEDGSNVQVRSTAFPHGAC